MARYRELNKIMCGCLFLDTLYGTYQCFKSMLIVLECTRIKFHSDWKITDKRNCDLSHPANPWNLQSLFHFLKNVIALEKHNSEEITRNLLTMALSHKVGHAWVAALIVSPPGTMCRGGLRPRQVPFLDNQGELEEGCILEAGHPQPSVGHPSLELAH